MSISEDEFSSKYDVFKVNDSDIFNVYGMCAENTTYYEYKKPMVTPESIRRDMLALPPGKDYDDKYYIGFTQDDILIAVMDLIFKFPNDTTAYIGFFMINKAVQGKGIGSEIIRELLIYLKKAGFSYVRLGYVKGNKESEGFWVKNGFVKTGVEKVEEDCTIIVLQRELA